MSKVKIHPAANLFPMIEQDKLQELADDIKANGLLDPVEFWDGQLIDGRNRLKACQLANVEPHEIDVTGGGSTGDPIDYVVSKNLHRRHLSESQRAMVAAKIRKPKPTTPGRQSDLTSIEVKSSDHHSRTSSAEVGKLLNVSRPSVDRATSVIKHGSPELVQAVERGEVSVARAAKVAKSTPKPEQLAKAKEKPAPKPKSTEPKLRTYPARHKKLLVSGFRSLGLAFVAVGIYDEFRNELHDFAHRAGVELPEV